MLRCGTFKNLRNGKIRGNRPFFPLFFFCHGFEIESLAFVWMRAMILALVNSATLTANYGVKQSQFTKPTSEPPLGTQKILMKPLTACFEDSYCSINVANHQLITVIRFVAKNYTHP